MHGSFIWIYDFQTSNSLFLTGSGTREITCTKNEIFGILRGKFHEQLETQIDILKQHFAKKEPNLEIDKDEKSDLKKILCNMKSRWKESYSKAAPFLSKNEKWLATTVTLKVNTCES